eukprot:4343484-Alexandrium_andersonii.AAC.1
MLRSCCEGDISRNCSRACEVSMRNLARWCSGTCSSTCVGGGSIASNDGGCAAWGCLLYTSPSPRD